MRPRPKDYVVSIGTLVDDDPFDINSTLMYGFGHPLARIDTIRQMRKQKKEVKRK